MRQKPALIIIYGPTGVGKSDYATSLAKTLPVEIVNCDVGQFYTPLSIGTAKPDWKHEQAPHHLFDIIDEPIDYTVVDYKKALLTTCQNIWDKGSVPVVVGGSGFYIKSLFFTPQDQCSLPKETPESFKDQPTEVLWNLLRTIDPERALQIHPHDRYRIERALTLAHLQVSLASITPRFEALGIPVFIVCLTRKRDDLYRRINERTEKMITAGWIEEVRHLEKSSWAPFLKRKKLIGYDDILHAFEQPEKYETLQATIAKKTRHYAKRQMTFWRLLQRNLSMHLQKPSTMQELLIDDTPQSIETFTKAILTFIANVDQV